MKAIRELAKRIVDLFKLDDEFIRIYGYSNDN